MKRFSLSVIVIMFLFNSGSLLAAAVDLVPANQPNTGLNNVGMPTKVTASKENQLKTLQTDQDQKIKVKTREWGPEFEPLKNLFAQATQDRKELNDLRERNIARYFAARDAQNPDYITIAHDITEETIAYIKKRITQTIIELGPPPTDFALFTMGSMARQESGFYTDLEIGILVKEKNINVIKYFQKFAQKLSDRFFLLGEHPDVGGKGFRMDEANNSPAHLHFFARYACEEQAKTLLMSALEKREFDKIPYEGSRIFLATPAEFAQHVNPNYLTQPENPLQKEEEEKLIQSELEKALQSPENKDRDITELKKDIKEKVKILLRPLSPKEKQISASLTSLVRNIEFLYGDRRLFNEYLKEREQYLSGPPKNKNPFYTTRRQEIAFKKMVEEHIKHMKKSESPIIMGKLGKEVDIKRELYRFPEQVLTNLGFYYNLGEQNTSKIAQKLAQEGLMSKDLSNQLTDLMNYLIGLRLKKQEICKKQIFALPTSSKEYNEQKEELEKELQELQKQRNLMIQAHSPEADIEKIDKDILKIQNSLIEFKKLKPLQETSILSEEEINTLNSKYLPILKKLFEADEAFISGNKNAFLAVTIPEKPIIQPTPIVQPIATIQPAQEQTSPISKAALETMIKNDQIDQVKAALQKGLIDAKSILTIASKYKKRELEKFALEIYWAQMKEKQRNK